MDADKNLIMNDFFKDLIAYFEVTPREKILEDWAQSAELDKVGPTVEEFLQESRQYYTINPEETFEVSLLGVSQYDPKFTSGFFMPNQS